MGRFTALIKGIALGAGVMYFWDPDMGNRRRALVRDRVTHTVTEIGATMDANTRDLRNRAGGIAAELRAGLLPEKVSDAKLVERIRSQIGHVLTHPNRVNVTSTFGNVMVRGEAPFGEVDAMYRAIVAVRGVRSIDLQIDRPGAEEGEISLTRYAEAKTQWTPGMRLMLGALGGGLALYGRRQGGLVGAAASAAGISLLTGTLRNTQMRQRPRPGRVDVAAHMPSVIDENTTSSNTEHMSREVTSF